MIVETLWKIVLSITKYSPSSVHVHCCPVFRLHIPSLQLCNCLIECTCIHVPVKCYVTSLKQCIPVECFYKFNKVVKFEQFCVVSRNMFHVSFILGISTNGLFVDEYAFSVSSLRHSSSMIENILVGLVSFSLFEAHVCNWLLKSKGLNL